MKPQLLLAPLHTEGINNGSPGKTRQRLEKSAAWKRQRIVVIIPAGSSISTKVYLSHVNLAFPPNNGVARIVAEGMEVGEAYSQAIENVLAHPELGTWEYILTLEHDNLVPPDAVLRLLEHMEENPKLSWISALYYTRGEGGVAQIWGDPKDPVLNFRPQMPDINGGLIRCNGTGMGCALWRMKMFKDKHLRKPWFVTQKRDGVATQDLYFATDAVKNGHKCAVACDVKVGHLDIKTGIIW
jgi:hypothetical protein